MLTSSLIDGTNVISVTWVGALTTDDVEELRAQFDLVATVHGDVRIILDVADAGQVEPAAVWEDLKSIRTVADLERMALVGDERWVEMVAAMESAVVRTDVEVFGSAQRDDALAWVTS